MSKKNVDNNEFNFLEAKNRLFVIKMKLSSLFDKNDEFYKLLSEKRELKIKISNFLKKNVAN